MDAARIVVVDMLIDGNGYLTKRIEPIEITQINLAFVIPGFLIPIFPWTSLPAHGQINAKGLSKINVRSAGVF